MILYMLGMPVHVPLNTLKDVRALWLDDTTGLQLLIWGKQQNRLKYRSRADRVHTGSATGHWPSVSSTQGATLLCGGRSLWVTENHWQAESSELYLDTTWHAFDSKVKAKWDPVSRKLRFHLIVITRQSRTLRLREERQPLVSQKPEPLSGKSL